MKKLNCENMNEAISHLISVMKTDYQRWLVRGDGKSLSDFAQEELDKFEDSVEVREGRKYIKIIRDKQCWGFIVNTDQDFLFNYGDILRPASWSTPARNKARGNVFHKCIPSSVHWTGPEYL